MDDLKREVVEIKKRLARLESQVVFLNRRLGIERKATPAWEPSESIIELVRAGKQTEAIRELIRETGASLKDAKTILENIKL